MMALNLFVIVRNLATQKTLPVLTLSYDVGDPQTYCAAALFSFQGANENPTAIPRASRPTARGAERPRNATGFAQPAPSA